MRILVFFLSDEHPCLLISNYLAAFGKDLHCLKPAILQACVEQHVILLVNSTESDCHLFNPACYLCNLLSDWHGSYVLAYVWSLMHPRHNRACADWISKHVLQNQCSKWVLFPVHAQVSCTVDPICYKPLRLCLHTIAQVSTREVAVCPGFVDMQTLRYLEILDKWQNSSSSEGDSWKQVTSCWTW